jgi:hypothetical protein
MLSTENIEFLKLLGLLCALSRQTAQRGLCFCAWGLDSALDAG